VDRNLSKRGHGSVLAKSALQDKHVH
jgi:hypothetical protein